LKSKQLKTKPTIFKSDILTFLLIGFGIVIFLITSILFYLSSHFDTYHMPKVIGLNSVKFEINSAHIDHDVSTKYNTTDLTNMTNAKNKLKELTQDKHWLFSTISICSAKQQEEINTILKQIQVFEKLIVIQDYTAASKQELNAVFNSLLNNIDNLQTGLNDRYIRQKSFVYYSEIIIIISLLLYLLSIFFIATKRNMVREKLLLEAQKSNYFLKEAQKMAKLIVYSFDFKTKHWEASESFSNIAGAEVTNNRLQSWIDRIHPKDRVRLTNLFNKRAQDPTTKFNETYRVVNATTGETHWVHHAIQDIKKDNKGNLLPVNGVIQDITQHKLAEEKIKRSNAILNKLNSLVLVINSEGEVTYVSKGIKTILGYKPKDILGQGWWQQTFPDAESAQRSKDSVYEYFSNEDLSFIPNEEFSLRNIKTKNGESKWINWSFTKESENSFIAIGVDITESYEKTKQFTTLTEIAHDAIILTNDIGNIIEVNQSARQMFGYSKSEILGKPATVLMPKKHKDSFVLQLNKANKEGNAKKSKFRIGEGITKKGVVFPVEISFNSWINNNKQIHCAFIKDITQQKYEEKIKEIIYNITKYAQEYPTLDALLPFIKKSLSSVIDTTTFFVSLYDDDKENFNSYEKIDPKNGKSFVNFPKGGSLFDQVVDTKKSLLYTKPSKINGTEIKSKCWVGVPLTVKQKVIGVMSIRSYTDRNAYTQKDVSLLELVASTISQVIQKTKDFEKINLLNQALVQSSAIILITNTKGEIEYVNPSFTKITGYEPNEVIGKNPRFIGVKNRNKHVAANLWKTIVNGKSWKGELTNIKKNGVQFTVMATIAPVKNNTEEVTHYIAVQEDITEKRKLEHQFVNGFIEAQEIERQSFGEELHDGISQILSAETMYINVLIKENQDRINGKAKFLTKIRELNLSAANEARNIAHGLMSNQLMKTGLIKAIENICLDYTNTKNIEFFYLHKNISENELSKEMKINIFRIIQEITANIIRHSKATETTVTFVKLKHGILNLVIKDNGIGFEYDKSKGLPKGVGIENIKRRITLLSGTLDIDTSPNNGLCYTINIPL
jgi:PAS domain S-box-containing protein